MKKALVLGGSGQLGIAVAEQLVDAEWRVFTAARSGRAPPPDLTRRGVVALDSPSGPVSEVLRSSGAVYDAVFVPTAYSAKDASDLLRVKGRFNSLVVVSSASVYADEHGRSLDEAAEGGFPDFEGAIGEDTRTVEPGDATYSTRKVAMERELLDDGLPVSILRPCAIYGKFARHPREWWVVKRVLDRRASIPVAYNADSLFHTSSVRSIATLAQICMEHPATRMLNVADPTALSVRQIAEAIGAALDAEVHLHPFAGAPRGLSRVGGTPWSTERPFVLDVARARKTGWDSGEEYMTAVSHVCDWLVATAIGGDWHEHFTAFAGYGYDPFDYVAEDQFMQGTGGRLP